MVGIIVGKGVGTGDGAAVGSVVGAHVYFVVFGSVSQHSVPMSLPARTEDSHVLGGQSEER